ncbi:tudor domain-containing protein krimp [Drosophila takahashii]|uniref:tudor domain-containing protein krimp n=1 Tax=Drosophila takahashii TaxID=29030 RepID=UPI001CF89BB3|nr:uncharacterized protein LOC108066347 [Drosophila takahashii]
MDLEDISVVMKLCDDNVHKLQENLRSYQRDVRRVRNVITERWANVNRLDRRIIALHDQLVGSLSEVNAYIIKLNLQIELNRPSGRSRENEKSGESLDELDISDISAVKAIEEAASDETDEQPPEQASVEKSREDSTQLVPVDLSMRLADSSLSSSECMSPECLSKSAPKDTCARCWMLDIESCICNKSFPEDSKVTTANNSNIKTQDTTPLQVKENPVVINSLPKDPKVATTTYNNISNQDSKNITPLQVKENPVAATLPSTWLIDSAEQIPASQPAIVPELPKTPGNRSLLAPKGGTQTTSAGIYNQIFKNMAAFPARTLVTAALVHVNIANECIYVAKWDDSSKKLRQILEGQMQLQELHQLPDYGDIFAVLDSSDNVVTRIIMNTSSTGGGYDAYLIDYGEHIHLNGNETIYELPDDVKRLPAEAIRCKLANYYIAEMKSFLYQNLKLRVLENNGIELVVEVLKDDLSKIKNSIKPINECRPELSEADMAMLNEIEEGTSDPLKAVLGFRPTDEQRICRHYDPKLNGCFKGNGCRLVHVPLDPDGATKDVEVVGALPETIFATPVPHKVGSIVRILITFVNGPTEVYAQIVDGSAPLVWEEKDVPEDKRHFKQKPHVLDIVLALYSDGCFYRAQIIDEMDTEFKIFYVDYGNTEFVPLSSLAPCDYVESLKPHRCISCHMEGIVRATFLTHQKTFECVEYLKSKVLNKEMDVKLVNRLPDGFQIRFLGDWLEIPRQLLNRKYAEHIGNRRNSVGEESLKSLPADENFHKF